MDQFIQDTVKKKQLTTVEQLVQLIQERFNISKEEALTYVIGLNESGKLKLGNNSTISPRKIYFTFSQTAWYWIIMVLNVTAVASAFIIPENAFPIVYVRYLFGSIFVFFLPGFCLIKALFPQKELEQIERAVLSVGISLAIVALISFLLNYTYWGITIATLTMSLVALTVTFATVAVLRERRVRVK